MKFNSLEELTKYLENKQATAMPKVGEEMKNIMKEETKKEVDSYVTLKYENTGYIIDCIDITMLSKDSVDVSWQDNGRWYSLSEKSYKDHMYAPWALEHGKVWASGSTSSNPNYRDSTDFVDNSTKQIEKDLPKKYKKIMNNLGISLE